MELIDFISDPERRKRLAKATKTSPDYLWQIATGHVRTSTGKPTRASTDLAIAIDRESARIADRVPKESLRPDVWTSKAA